MKIEIGLLVGLRIVYLLQRGKTLPQKGCPGYDTKLHHRFWSSAEYGVIIIMSRRLRGYP